MNLGFQFYRSYFILRSVNEKTDALYSGMHACDFRELTNYNFGKGTDYCKQRSSKLAIQFYNLSSTKQSLERSFFINHYNKHVLHWNKFPKYFMFLKH